MARKTPTGPDGPAAERPDRAPAAGYPRHRRPGTGIDLHAHSTASDGTFTPADLVRAAAREGLDVVAVTDHDTTDGWQAAIDARPPGLTLVPGAELSCRWSGTDPPISLHLLAYLFDPAEPVLAAELAGVRAGRATRAERTVELLNADGIDVTWDEVLADATGGVVGRPHLARALVRRRLVASVDEAFTPPWLGRRYRVPKREIDVFAALRLVRAAGGAAVFAHPFASRRGRIVPDRLLGELAEEGLTGIEADHDDHTPEERVRAHRLAADLGLVATGSSDFHGSNKKVRLGAHTTTAAGYERIMVGAWGRMPVGDEPETVNRGV